MEYAHPRNDHTHAHAISFHDTFARKRTRTTRSNVFYRSFAFAKFFFSTSLCVRAVGSTICFFREKRFFKKSILLGNQQKQKPALSKGFKTRRERERKSRAEQREREKEKEKERRNTYRWIYGQFVWYEPFLLFFCAVFFLFLLCFCD